MFKKGDMVLMGNRKCIVTGEPFTKFVVDWDDAVGNRGGLDCGSATQAVRLLHPETGETFTVLTRQVTPL